MSWYSVSFILKSEHPEAPQYEKVWEEQIVLIQAEDSESAKNYATDYAKTKELEYISATGLKTFWSYKGILDCYELSADSLGHKTEIFSRHLDESQIEALRKESDFD